MIRLGTAPSTWGIEPGADPAQAPWQLVLDEVAAVGFDGIELGPLGYFPTDVNQLSSELSSRGLELAGGNLMEPFHDPEQTSRILRVAERTCALIAGAGAGTLVLIGSLVPTRSAAAGRAEAAPLLRGPERVIFIRTVRAIIERAEEHQLNVALHPHAGTYVEFEDEIDVMLDEVGSRLGLCIDTGHSLYSGVDVVGLLERHAERVRHVHLRDVRWNVLRRALYTNMSFEQAAAAGTFCPLGDGSVRLESLLDHLSAIGYDGWATYEQHRLAPEHPSAPGDAERSLAHLEHLGLHPRARAL